MSNRTIPSVLVTLGPAVDVRADVALVRRIGEEPRTSHNEFSDIGMERNGVFFKH